jgi:hypothetical protein
MVLYCRMSRRGEPDRMDEKMCNSKNGKIVHLQPYKIREPINYVIRCFAFCTGQ